MKRIIFILIVLLNGCNFHDELYYEIAPEVQIHVDTFYEEAAKRGVRLEKTNLIVMYELCDGIKCKWSDLYGLSFKEGDQRIVYIVDDYLVREEPDALECLVFHELGHALLYRSHTTEYSIMGERNNLLEYKGNPELREWLLDELFTPRK